MKKFAFILTALVLVLALSFGACAETLTGACAETLTGGWTLTEDPAMTEDASKAFDEAMETLVGVDYTPVALLATQVVAGTNYCVLCSTQLVTATPENGYALVYIYAPVSGDKAEILGITNLDEIMIGEMMPAA